jgi:death-on-curing protein
MRESFHAQLLAEFGGSGGIRDGGLLDSALGRPENRFADGQPSLSEFAASDAFEWVKNHPFVDGIERIGFAIGAVFLQLNGGNWSQQKWMR